MAVLTSVFPSQYCGRIDLHIVVVVLWPYRPPHGGRSAAVVLTSTWLSQCCGRIVLHIPAAVLWSRGTTHLDAIIVSHADVDHFNAVPTLLERFSVGALYVSPAMMDDDSPAIAALRRAVESHGVPMRKIAGGTHVMAFVTPLLATLFLVRRWGRTHESFIREKGAAKMYEMMRQYERMA